MEGWQQVYASDQPHLIQVAMAILQENDIRAVELNQKDSSYITVGEIGLYVPVEVAPLALVILEQHHL